ncbi:MAG: UvrD-helicase domain-containing protein [Firmicutes bacterium]|nr:UvrD-helicase domain-containing protein [Bacillota bacterium]
MNERKWTESQLEAINDRSDTILVFAAAGSGKTAVLTERIIKLITDGDEPIDITRLLVVTFTKAAASEIRERVGDALNKAMREHPNEKARLRRQKNLLPQAKISTIHSFCLDLIKNNFQKLGISAKSRVAEEAQTKLLIRRIMDDTVESYYNAEPGKSGIADFSAFTDNIITLRDEKLADVFAGIYTKVSSQKEGIDFIKRCADELEEAASLPFEDTKWGEVAANELRELYISYKQVCENALDFINAEQDFLPYEKSFESDLSHTSAVLELLGRDTAGAFRLVKEYEPTPLGRVKTELQTPEILFYKSLRTDFSGERKAFEGKYLRTAREDYEDSAKRSALFCRDLYTLLSEFEKRYTAEKRRRALLDYNDLERLALILLSDPETAEKVAMGFDEIMIDEYQDTNDVQDMIFSLISRGKCVNGAKRFMVGDIKQSIYGFRGAEPSIFASYRRSDDTKKIFLQHNFRCDEPIIKFVNGVCGYLFKAGNGTPYSREDDLVFGKTGVVGQMLPEIAVVGTEGEDKVSEEAEYIAGRIAGIIGEEGKRPSDIAVLLRQNSGGVTEKLEEALKKRGVPCCSDGPSSLFETPEVLLVMCLLNCINNPERDVYLAGLLKSPLFGFSLDDLVRIRSASPQTTLYEALRSYLPFDETGKCGRFLEKLEEYRAKAEAEKTDELLRYLYDDAAVMSVIGSGEDGYLKRENLLLLYETARSFENGSFKGLYNFITYVNGVIDSSAPPKKAKPDNEGSNAVRIMTVHQSKGLEFPVVFLCDTARKINVTDIRSRIMIDKKLGVAPKLTDRTGYAYFDSLFRRALGSEILRELCEEEMRVLYVALTRARERLIITSSSSDPEALIEKSRAYADSLQSASLYDLKKNACYINWILSAVLSSGERLCEITYGKAEETAGKTSEECASQPDIPSETADENFIRGIIDFKYPYGAAAKLPAKLSVSDLSPSVLDTGEDSCSPDDVSESEMRTPRFLTEAPEYAGAAEKGTATHLFMQFCDFRMAESGGVENELKRLCRLGFMSASDAEKADTAALDAFFKSDFYRKMSESEDVRRELRFNIKLPAGDFTENSIKKETLENEEILIQGVIDCVFLNPDGTLTVADYKTDRIPFGMKRDEDAFERLLCERHFRQLGYYKKACEKIFGKRVSVTAVYSFALGREVDVKV